jgi:multidrug resistance efflux pump
MFNKVYAPFSGTIARVLVDTDGSIISKGQPIFKVVPDEIAVEVSPEEIAARRQAATHQFLQQL